jgi:prolyl-tRNA synthetase
MYWSQHFIPTLREAPADAEIASHRLLLRAGLVRKLAGGIYSFLPAGLRALRKVEDIIREEMNRAGAMEVMMPALQPDELWRSGPRYDAAQRVMFRAKSATPRAGEAELFLGPTHEEVITSLVADNIQSYRQLPRTFYQIQTKFRDEIRPRFGLMRAKEFIMKDAYSFDVDDAGAVRSYQTMYAAYEKIFARMGLTARPVEADTGVMGGSFSHEFSVPCDVGESEIVTTADGSYAAAIEKAAVQPCERQNPDNCADLEEFATPGARTIEDLVRHHAVAACDQVKTLVYICDSKPVVFLLRGDDELIEDKIAALGFAEFRPALDDEIRATLGASPGSLGATRLRPSAVSAVYADLALQGQRGMVTGANRDGYHLRNLDIARDIPSARWVTLRRARRGDTIHGQPVSVDRAIEVGHVFKLGTKYSEAFHAKYLDTSGTAQLMVMGCYGIGVTRCLQAVIEQNHDDNGIIWPASVAPYQVVLSVLDTPLLDEARALAAHLESCGVDCLIDDRDERPGVKFKDADLVGFPVRITLGEKSRKAGGVEVKGRREAKGSVVPADQVVSVVKSLLSATNTPAS